MPTIADIPNDCLRLIFLHLSPKDLLRVEKVSKRWKRASKKCWNRSLAICTTVLNCEFLDMGNLTSEDLQNILISSARSLKHLAVASVDSFSTGTCLLWIQNHGFQTPNFQLNTALKLLSKNCRNLETITLNFFTEDNRFVKTLLLKNRHLKKLGMGNSVFDKYIDYNNFTSSLTDLKLQDVSVMSNRRSFLMFLSTLTSLENFTLEIKDPENPLFINCMILTLAKKSLRLRSFEYVDLCWEEHNISTETLMALSNFVHLKKLKLCGKLSNVTNWVLKKIIDSCQNIQHFVLENLNNVNNQILPAIMALPKLQSLRIKGINHISFAPLGSVANLTSFEIQMTFPFETHALCNAIAMMPSLAQLIVTTESICDIIAVFYQSLSIITSKNRHLVVEDTKFGAKHVIFLRKKMLAGIVDDSEEQIRRAENSQRKIFNLALITEYKCWKNVLKSFLNSILPLWDIK